MPKAKELRFDDLLAAASKSNAVALTAAGPGWKPSPADGRTKMAYRIGLTILCGATLLPLAACSGGGSSGGGDSTDTTPPSAPTTLSATAASQTEIDLAWVAATDNIGVTGYQLERCQGASCVSFAQVATPTAVTLNDTGLSAGTSYSYRARAVDAAGNPGPYSNIASASTLPPTPAAPTGVTATPGNTLVTFSWPAVPGATSYNVYSSPTDPATVSGTKTTVTTPGATLSSLTNGTPIFAVVTAANAGGESALSAGVCAVPTAASTAGLTLYDPLCERTLDGTKWQNPLFSRSVVSGAMELRAQVSNMESRSIQGQNYFTVANVTAGAQRVTTLKADVNVPAATASRTGSAEIRAIAQLSYEPPASRLNFPGGQLDSMFIQIGLADMGSGLRAFRRVIHCDNASCTSRSVTGITFVDPGGFTPNTNGIEADTAAAYDTTYTVSASLNESTGVFSWSIAGGSFGAGVTGTADPAVYLAGNANWTALGPNPLAGAGFVSAFLRTQVSDDTVPAGSNGSVSARFGNVQVGFNNAAATLWDDFSGTGANSGPTELSAAKWSPPGAGKNSMALTAGSLAGHAQITSVSTAGIQSFQAINFSNPAAINTMQADVTVSSCSNSLSGTNRAGIGGSFYNDGTPGTTPPDINQPNSRVGDISASLFLDCFFGLPRFQISRFDTAAGAQTLLSNSVNQTVPMGPAPFIGGTHTLTLKWDPATHFFTFQVDGATPVVVDPTTVNAFMNVAAPYAKPANSPAMNLSGFLFVPPAGAPAVGATASMDFKINNVFTTP
jgi:fibronectin type III domain protein